MNKFVIPAFTFVHRSTYTAPCSLPKYNSFPSAQKCTAVMHSKALCSVGLLAANWNNLLPVQMSKIDIPATSSHLTDKEYQYYGIRRDSS